MKKALGVGLSTLLILVIGAAAAFASANVTLGLSASSVEVGDGPVTVTAEADGTINHQQARVRLDICDTWDETLGGTGAFSGVYQSSQNCEDGVNGAEWRENIKADDAPFGETTTISYAFTETSTPGTVGFRARYRPGDAVTHDEDGNVLTAQTRFADLAIVAPTQADKHAGCQGIEKAYAQVTSKGNGKGNAAKALEKVANELLDGCDLPEAS